MSIQEKLQEFASLWWIIICKTTALENNSKNLFETRLVLSHYGSVYALNAMVGWVFVRVAMQEEGNLEFKTRLLSDLQEAMNDLTCKVLLLGPKFDNVRIE